MWSGEGLGGWGRRGSSSASAAGGAGTWGRVGAAGAQLAPAIAWRGMHRPAASCLQVTPLQVAAHWYDGIFSPFYRGFFTLTHNLLQILLHNACQHAMLAAHSSCHAKAAAHAHPSCVLRFKCD